MPHLQVMARHDGGEIATATATGLVQDEELTGTGWPVHKTKGGGWAQLEVPAQHRGSVGDQRQGTGRAGDRRGRAARAELIVVAGDPTARTLLVRQLGPDLAALTVVIDREVTEAWATILAAGGLLLIGAVAARADDARREDHRRGEHRPARQHDGAIASQIISPLVRTSPEEVEFTRRRRPAPARGGRSRARQPRRSRRQRDHGRWARGEERGGRGQLIIASACTENMDEAAIIGETTLGSSHGGSHASGVGDITAGVSTITDRQGRGEHHRRSRNGQPSS